jgi:hypothetical protein
MVVRDRGLECVRRIRIEISDNGVFLSAREIAEPAAQISKVFMCPHYSFEAGIEMVRGHDIIEE